MNKQLLYADESGLLSHISWIFATIFIFMAGHSFAASNLEKIDIDGFRLGMTMDEVQKAHPDIVAKEIKPDGGVLIGYRVNIGEVALSFTTAELGYSLFNIQKVRFYPSKQNTFPIFSKYIKKYGTPDYSGRQMFHIQACWGRCYGKNRRLEFRMKISGVANQPFPMTLTLSDPKIEGENRRLFLKKIEDIK